MFGWMAKGRACVALAGVWAMWAMLWSSGVAAQWLDPDRDWRTAETPHFRIHFEGEARAVAQRTGEIAERAYALLSPEFNWTLRDRVDVVLYSGVDLPNGFASPLPFNRSGIFLAAPREGELLERSDWMELVLLHELTHVFHLDKAQGAPAVMRRIFGRLVWTFPNALQPPWLVEGLAVQSESRVGNGLGRLHSPWFEAQMRDERNRGFISLRELNANGRRLPLNRNYLYGAYFFDYLTRTYGAEAAARHVAWYSQQLLPFRVNNSTYVVTGKPMDVVWAEFLADLTKQVDQRSAALRAVPQQVGETLTKSDWNMDALKITPSGVIYAVTDDGINAPVLQRYGKSEAKQNLVTLHEQAQIDVRADGAVLIAQPEMCDSYELMFDLYQWSETHGLQRMTRCQRYLKGVWLGTEGQIVAVRNDRGGMTHLELFDSSTQTAKVLVAGEAARSWLDVAAMPDGRAVVALSKRGGVFSVVRIDIASGAQTLLYRDNAPVNHLHVAHDGALIFVSSRDGVPNVWRQGRIGEKGGDKNGEKGVEVLQRLTHAHTAVVQFGGMAQDGTLALGTLDTGRVQLRQMRGDAAVQAQESRPALAASAAATSVTDVASALPPAAQPVNLSAERDYSPLPSLRPRAWWPVLFSERGMLNVGVSLFGADALGLHNYLLTPYVEVTEGELLGIAEYSWRQRHFVAVKRELKVRRWTGGRGDQEPLEYERISRGQWISLARMERIERSLAVGLGAALSRRDGIVIDGLARREEDERVAALVALYDSRRGGVLSEGPSRGQQAQLFYESYRPFRDADRSPYSGGVVRALWDGYLPLGRTVLAAHWVEGRGQVGRTENFVLGGESSHFESLAPTLNDRDIGLRGYPRGAPGMFAANARRVTVEWRTPLADVDRHLMVPPIGMNRISAAVFYEAGGVWNNGGGPQDWLRSTGVEALTEVRLGYLLPVQLRIGVARGLDAAGETRTYVLAGRAF